MPIYGDAKTRTMVRSILPSSKRKSARFDRAKIHRAARRRDNQMIDSYLGDWDEYTGPLGARYGRTGSWEDEEIDNMKWERRNGDKDAPIMRWGPTMVTDVRRMDRLSKLKTLFPKNLPGRHAISHLANADEIEIPDGTFGFGAIPRYTLRERHEKNKATWVAEKAVMAGRITEMLHNGGHSYFNGRLKTRWATFDPTMPGYTAKDGTFFAWRHSLPPKVVYRPLGGLHDVEAFVDYIHRTAAWEMVDHLLS